MTNEEMVYVEAADVPNLQRAVNEKLAEGWERAGSAYHDGLRHIQPMARKAQTKKNLFVTNPDIRGFL